MENDDRENAIRERLGELFELAVAQGLEEDEEVWQILSDGAELMIWLDQIGQYFFDEVTAIDCPAICYDDGLLRDVLELLQQIDAIEIDEAIYEKYGQIGYLTSGTFDDLDGGGADVSDLVDASQEDGDMCGHTFPDREEVICELNERLDEARELTPMDRSLFEGIEWKLHLAWRFIEELAESGNDYIVTKHSMFNWPLFEGDRDAAKMVFKFLRTLDVLPRWSDRCSSDGARWYELSLNCLNQQS